MGLLVVMGLSFDLNWDWRLMMRAYERSLGRRVGAIAMKQASLSGAIAKGRMELSLDFAAEHFSQTMAGLMIVKPGSLALGADYAFVPGERKLPVKLDADVYKDTVRSKLPAGYKVDEMPAALGGSGRGRGRSGRSRPRTRSRHDNLEARGLEHGAHSRGGRLSARHRLDQRQPSQRCARHSEQRGGRNDRRPDCASDPRRTGPLAAG